MGLVSQFISSAGCGLISFFTIEMTCDFKLIDHFRHLYFHYYMCLHVFMYMCAWVSTCFNNVHIFFFSEDRPRHEDVLLLSFCLLVCISGCSTYLVTDLVEGQKYSHKHTAKQELTIHSGHKYLANKKRCVCVCMCVCECAERNLQARARTCTHTGCCSFKSTCSQLFPARSARFCW